MRRLDRFVGVPLCRLLTFFRCCVAPFRPPRKALLPRKVLFVQLAEAGSMVLADPALAAVAAAGGTPYFVTLASNAAALRLTGQIPESDVFVLRDDSILHLFTDLLHLRSWVRLQGIDAVVDLELFVRLAAVLSLWCGTPRRAGFHAEEGGALYRGHLLTDPVRFNPHIHMSRNYLRLVGTLMSLPGQLKHRSVRQTHPSPAARARAVALLRENQPTPGMRWVLVSPNASDRLPQRRWPAERFSLLIEQLLAIRPDVAVLLIGSAEDRRITDEVAHRVGKSRCIDIAGRLMLDELPALFEQASLLIANDSGPAHFAAVSGLPVVVLFGPETPTLFSPLGPATVITAGLSCSPCVSPANQRRSVCENNLCMQRIPVDEVLRASLDWLAQVPLRRVSSATLTA